MRPLLIAAFIVMVVPLSGCVQGSGDPADNEYNRNAEIYRAGFEGALATGTAN
jgi:hypothetical protein